MTKKEVSTYHFEMLDKSWFMPKENFRESIETKEIVGDAFFNFMLFVGVGLPWHWYSRLGWSIAQWEKHFDQNNCKVFLGFQDNTPIGYFELQLQEKHDIEIKFFGLLPSKIGTGIGGQFLSFAIDTAWQLGAKRVWLHTCTSDHENAPRNYSARGFRLFKQETAEELVPNKDEMLQQVSRFLVEHAKL